MKHGSKELFRLSYSMFSPKGLDDLPRLSDLRVQKLSVRDYHLG